MFERFVTRTVFYGSDGFSRGAVFAAVFRRFLLLICCVTACLPGTAIAGVGVSTTVLTVDDIYTAPKYRDPLMTSTVFGDEHAPKSTAMPGGVLSSTFSVYNLSLIGIMEDSRSKEALLSDKATGVVYVLKGGRLLDAKKKPVPDVSGVIKGKQVILTTQDKQVHQLNLREKE